MAAAFAPRPATVVLLVPPRGGSSTRERDAEVAHEFTRSARRFLSEFAGASALASGCDEKEIISCLVATPSGVAVAMPFVSTASVPAALRADTQLVAGTLLPLTPEPPAVVAALSKVARLVSSGRGPPGGCFLVVLCASTFAMNRKLSGALDTLSALKIGVAWSHLYVDVESRLASAGVSAFALGGVDAQGVKFCRQLSQLLQTNQTSFEMRALDAAEMQQCAHKALRHARVLTVAAVLVQSADDAYSTPAAGDDTLSPIALEVIPLQLQSRLHVEFGLDDPPHGSPLQLRIETLHRTSLASVDLTLMHGAPHVVRARYSGATFVSSMKRVTELHGSLTRAKHGLVVRVSAEKSSVRPRALLLPRAKRPHELVLLFMVCADTFLDLPQLGLSGAAASGASVGPGGGEGGEADEQDRAEESGAPWQLPCIDFTPLHHSSGARAHALRPARRSSPGDSDAADFTVTQKPKPKKRRGGGGGGGGGGRGGGRARRL